MDNDRSVWNDLRYEKLLNGISPNQIKIIIDAARSLRQKFMIPILGLNTNKAQSKCFSKRWKCLTHDRIEKESFRYTAYPGMLLNYVFDYIIDKTFKFMILFGNFLSTANYYVVNFSTCDKSNKMKSTEYQINFGLVLSLMILT